MRNNKSEDPSPNDEKTELSKNLNQHEEEE